MWPFEVRDERILDFDLPPQKVVPPTQVIQSAEQLRNEAQRGLVTPMVKPAHEQMQNSTCTSTWIYFIGSPRWMSPNRVAGGGDPFWGTGYFCPAPVGRRSRMPLTPI